MPSPVQPNPTWPPSQLGHIPAADDLLCALDGSIYDVARVENQLGYLSDRADDEERHATQLALATVGFGGAAAFGLAASWGPGRWPGLVAAVATAFVAALITWREHLQRDATADGYRMTVAIVSAVRARWLSVPSTAQSTPNEIARYVEEVEEALAVENATWERSLSQSQRAFLGATGRR